MINNNLVEANCPQCNQIEMRDHVVKFGETTQLRKDFIMELLSELVKKNDEIRADTIMAFGEDILRYLEYGEDEEYVMNQYLFGMRELFQRYAVKV